LDSVLLGIAATKTKRPLAFATISAIILAIGIADVLVAAKLSGDTARA